MASSKFNKVQAALQTAKGSYVAPTIQLPWKATYEDKRQVHVAEYDAGAWTPTGIVAEVGSETAMAFEGTAFFELMPVLFNSGLADVAPTATYLHTYTVSPAAVAVPMPLSVLAGTVSMPGGAGGTPFVTGPAIKFIDQYVKTVNLSANINDKIVMVKAETFGTTYDSGTADAGFAFINVGLPATMQTINGMKGVISTLAAGTTGGVFTGMLAMSCTLVDWEWELDTGIEPAWCLTDNVTTWSSLKYTSPSCTFKPIIRTSTVSYAAIKRAADAGTYQELQLYIVGSDPATRYLKINMTGRWDVVPTVHDEQDGEVVIKPTFLVETPHTQTTTPHWLTITNLSTHNWT
jgi:hypothetical protein